MGDIIPFRKTPEVDGEWIGMEEWAGEEWKAFFSKIVCDIAEQTGRDVWDVFAEIMHTALNGTEG